MHQNAVGAFQLKAVFGACNVTHADGCTKEDSREHQLPPVRGADQPDGTVGVQPRRMSALQGSLGRAGALWSLPVAPSARPRWQGHGLQGRGSATESPCGHQNPPQKDRVQPAFIEDFAREARAAAAASIHPNVAQVYAFGEYDDQYYLAMELLERGSLDNRIAKSGKLSEREVLELGLQIAAGLRAAQAHGLLHRDIKPGNILFSAGGAPKIVDFGLSRVRDRVNNQNGQPEAIWGTPYYIAPEKLRGNKRTSVATSTRWERHCSTP